MEPLFGIDFGELTAQQMNGVVAITVALGTLYCFLGYRTLKTVIALTGFLIAGVVAGAVVGWISEGHAVAMLIGAAFGGLCGAMALFFLYRTGIFLLGLCGATLAAQNVLAGRPEAWAPLLILAVGFLGGLVALVIESPVMMMATASIGAWFVVSGVVYFLSADPSGAPELLTNTLGSRQDIVLGSWFVLAFAGGIAQFATRKRPKPAPQ